MRKLLLFAVLLLLGLGAVAQNTAKLTEEMQRQLKERTASDEQFRIIITMADQYDQTKMTQQTQYLKGDQRREFVINELSRFSSASQADLLKTLNEGKKANIVKEVNSFWIFNGVSCITTREMIYALSERPDIAYIESDEMRNMLPETSLEAKKQSFKVANPQTAQTNRAGATSIAWNVAQVHADQVWTYNGTTGYNGSGVVVAVIDTGLDYYHPDIISHIWQPKSNTVTVTHSGDENPTTYTLGTFQYNNTTYTLPGWDFVSGDPDPVDDNGHGSHCAGTVAGNGTSGIQTGMAPGATIMALKVLAADGSGSSTGIMKAMEFAVAAKADVVSMSLGGHSSGLGTLLGSDDSYRTSFSNMMTLGVVAMVAAGNEGEIYNSYHEQASGLLGIAGDHYAVPDNVGNPGNCPSPWANPEQPNQGGRSAVVTIGASNRNDRKATFSSFGPCTWKRSSISATIYSDYEYDKNDASKPGLIKPDVLVPGTDITSMYYKYMNPSYYNVNGYANQADSIYYAECGTSMATPGAAGITALIIQAYKAKNGEKPTPAQIDSILEVTALPVDFRDMKNNTTGAGRADAKAAVDAIYTTATQPTGFSVTETNGGCVHLSWTASVAPKGYAIYRNNEQVGVTTELTYTDKNPGAGKHTYYVRAIDNAGIQSVRSKAAFCTVEPYAFADNANITWNDETKTATLGWTPTLSNDIAKDTLKIIGAENTYSAFTGTVLNHVYWGICFNPEDLRPYQGMSIDSVTIVVHNTNLFEVDYPELNIYRGTLYGNTTTTPAYHERFTVRDLKSGWNVIKLKLSTPYALTDITEDLWITFDEYINNNSEYPIGFGPYNGHNSNVFYMGSTKQTVNPENDLVWSHIPDFGDLYNYAVSLEAHLTRTTTYTGSYTIDYPDATQDVTVSNISGNYTTPHMPTLASGENTYKIIAKASYQTIENNTIQNHENTSCPEKLTVVKVDNNRVEASADIDQTKVYLVQSNGTLTCDNLISNDATRLIVEDGGQVFTSSTDVKGTVKKAVASFNDATNCGWKFIASPMSNDIPASDVVNLLDGDNYDLFYYDEQDHYWRNYLSETNNHFDIEPTKGYLYANSGKTIKFAGTLRPSNSNVNIPLSYHTTTTAFLQESVNPIPGWNLVGNPFPCTAYTNRSFYKVVPANNDKKTALSPVAASANTAIAPSTGIMVVATEENQSVGFSKTSYGISSSTNQGNVHIAVAQQVAERGETSLMTADNAIVSFVEGDELEKFTLADDNAKLYIPQGNKELAIAVAEPQGETPLCFKPYKAGNYTITVTPENTELTYLHLIDNKAGVDVDLLETPSYSFSATLSDYESRFRLLFDTDQVNDEETDLFAFFNGSNWFISNQGVGTLEVVDMMGRVVSTHGLNGNANVNVNSAAGVYTFRLVNDEKVKTQKVVVR